MGILDGKAGVVTGGGRGIGRGHCLHLAAQGAGVVVNDVDLDEAGKVVEEIVAAGGRALASDADIGSRKGAGELVARCVDEFGAIHAVVNNAGIVRDRSFLKMSDEEWEDVLRIHAGGTFWCAQHAANRMREQGTGGAIVNTVSAAHMGNFGQTNYGAAKGAIASMTYTWANGRAVWTWSCPSSTRH
jgi:3-oxoacyl-[acyl-carrier protein] reductase